MGLPLFESFIIPVLSLISARISILPLYSIDSIAFFKMFTMQAKNLFSSMSMFALFLIKISNSISLSTTYAFARFAALVIVLEKSKIFSRLTLNSYLYCY